MLWQQGRKMEVEKSDVRNENGNVVISHSLEPKQTFDHIRMTFKVAIMDSEVNIKSETGQKPVKRQLSEEELEARRRINRLRMAAARAGRSMEQIQAERMSQRARMAALRKRRSQQEIIPVHGGVKMTLNDSGEMNTAHTILESDNTSRKTYSPRRQLSPEELDVRRRIHRIRVSMMRARRTQDQIEADRRAQRLRMAEYRKRRSEEQVVMELESQRARMAALRRERRRLREASLSGDSRTLIKEEMENEANHNYCLSTERITSSGAGISALVPNNVQDSVKREVCGENDVLVDSRDVCRRNGCTNVNWIGPLSGNLNPYNNCLMDDSIGRRQDAFYAQNRHLNASGAETGSPKSVLTEPGIHPPVIQIGLSTFHSYRGNGDWPQSNNNNNSNQIMEEL